MCDIGNKRGLFIWILLCSFLGPLALVSTVLMVIVWMSIAAQRSKPAWIGVLTLFPLFILPVAGYLAFSE